MKRFAIRFSFIALLLALCLGTSSQAQAASKTNNGCEGFPAYHTVTGNTPSNTLWGLAEKYYGIPQRADIIAADNRVDPELIQKGKVIRIPCLKGWEETIYALDHGGRKPPKKFVTAKRKIVPIEPTIIADDDDIVAVTTETIAVDAFMRGVSNSAALKPVRVAAAPVLQVHLAELAYVAPVTPVRTPIASERSERRKHREASFVQTLWASVRSLARSPVRLASSFH